MRGNNLSVFEVNEEENKEEVTEEVVEEGINSSSSSSINLMRNYKDDLEYWVPTATHIQ